MKLLKKKAILGPIISLILILSFVTSFPAHAYSWVSSGELQASVYGYTYTYYSEIAQYNSTLMQYGTTGSTTVMVPLGYIGAMARLYTSSGAIVASSAWNYNTSSSGRKSQYSYYTASNYPSAAYFYSLGKVQFYNGNGYSTYVCLRTPNMASPYTGSRISTYQDTTVRTNQNGEIYGSELFLSEIGVEPDLILAIGTNNVCGYVRASDLEPVINSPEEALEYQQTLEPSKTIPLYEEDGTTIIGSFVIDNSGSLPA